MRAGRRNWPWTEPQKRTLRQIKLWRRQSKTQTRVAFTEIAIRLNKKEWWGPGGRWSGQAVARQAEKDGTSLPKRIPKTHLKPDEYLTYEQVAALKRACPARDKQILDFLLATGLRPGCEFAKLENRDLEFTILGPVIHVRCGKGKKKRFVSISDVLSKKLQAARVGGEGDPTFPDTKGHKLSARALRSRLAILGRSAKVKGVVNPTRIRHTFGTLLYDNGKDLKNVADQMGHSDINTSCIYVTVLANARSEQADRLQKRLDSLDDGQQVEHVDTPP
ncbi:MAG: tyrosine-type recombinase/integrase [Dehalococcoidales bacterium]